MPDALIIDAVRTPMGRYRGALSRVRPDDLAAHAIGAAVERTGLDPERVADVHWGAANQAGEDNRDVARMASLLAGLPVGVPGVTVNRLCASGLEAVNGASRALRLGEGELYLAGGSESMSRAPWVVPKPEVGLPRGGQTMHDTALGWRLVNPRMAERYSTEAMGETAENVADRHAVSRADQDAFALRSHRRALEAAASGRFAEELVAITPPPPDGGDPTLVEADEGPRADTSLERLAQLRPAFREGGTVTAGNASTLNDGAACLVLASE
ncbi:MAG: acetyl-CoA C-acyltransferase, partial [Solirubrobacterales bacterium]